MCLVFPPQTALHWAAKHGSADVVKLIAGTYQADVNARSVSSFFTVVSICCFNNTARRTYFSPSPWGRLQKVLQGRQIGWLPALPEPSINPKKKGSFPESACYTMVLR
jgi:hypothetical protein